MPKIKTHRGAKKRFKKTGSGKIKAYHAFKSHLLGWKASKRKRHLRKAVMLAPSDEMRLKRLLP
ncbi:MAG: 50S ribosomal protein L35 [Peptococcaceae bacterium]|nr:50S ribosomal protein L35 [Peptococcaceae bacterium]